MNYTIRFIIENRATSLNKAHKLLYNTLKKGFGLPSRVALDCYREAIAIAKSWLSNGKRGRIPSVKTLRIWLSHRYSYRIRKGYVEIVGGTQAPGHWLGQEI